LALVIKYCPRWPEPMMPSRTRSFAPQTRSAAAAVAAPTTKVLRDMLFVNSVLLLYGIEGSPLLQRRDDEDPFDILWSQGGLEYTPLDTQRNV